MRIHFLLIMMLIFVSLSTVSAETISQRQDAELDQQYIISQPCATCSYINISVFTKEGVVLDNVPMANNGSTWTYTFTPNASLRHDVNGIGDINGLDDSFAFYFLVSPTSLVAIIILIFFFLAVFLGFYNLHSRVNFDKWYNSILNRYQHKNSPKVILSGLGYNLLKSPFLIYYFLGFPIILLVMEVTHAFNITAVLQLLKSILTVYSLGIIVVGVMFFGKLQEFVVETVSVINKRRIGV